MAKCRIYLFTYNRNNLLERAVKSLLSQTFKDWVCEVHNDLPGNTFPESYIASLNDERFTVINHPVNLGTTQSFNLAFAGCDEHYASILEDDNWWEDDFLSEMIGTMEKHPTINVMWSNMFTWEELADGTWLQTGDTLWPVVTDQLFSWPQPVQALGSLHSTGAMIYRGSKAANYIIPADTLSNAVELVRERCFEHPIYLLSRPLANFSYTLVSSQSKNREKWVGLQIMMLASFVLNSDNSSKTYRDLLKYYRGRKPSPTPVFALALIFYIKRWSLIFTFNLSDWLSVIRWFLANLFNISPLKQYLKSQQETWLFLKKHTPHFTNINFLDDPV